MTIIRGTSLRRFLHRETARDAVDVNRLLREDKKTIKAVEVHMIVSDQDRETPRRRIAEIREPKSPEIALALPKVKRRTRVLDIADLEDHAHHKVEGQTAKTK